MSGGPLSGVRVLDMTRILAGPFCTMLLGDLGADVVKIERPGSGDDTRSWRPPAVGSESAYFLSVNRNKRSLALDLRSPAGRDLATKLAQESDILVENFIPGTMERLGLGYDQLKPTCPRLIFASLTGFGPTGPWAKRGGFDVIAAALGGLMHITGAEDGEPAKVGVAVTDLMTGLYLHGAVMAALLHRSQNGDQGQRIDANLLSTQIATLANIGGNYLNGGKAARRWGTAHESIVPYQAFRTKDDKYLVIGAGNDAQFAEMCRILEMPELMNDPRFVDNASRVRNRHILVPLLCSRVGSRNCEAWESAFGETALPVGRVNSIAEAFAHPQVQHNKSVVGMEHPRVGPIRVAAPAVRFGLSENRPRCPPPTLGQHSEEVLMDWLNMPPSEIAQLKTGNVIQSE